MNFTTKLLTLFIILCASLTTHAQDTIYLAKNGKPTDLKNEAVDYQVLFRDADNPDAVIVRKYHDNGNLAYEDPYSSYKDKKNHGVYRTWFENGDLRSENEFINGKKHGLFTTYWENGKKKREDHFKNGKFKKGTTWDENGNEEPYYEFEIVPVFPGGKKGIVKYIKENTVKPEGAAGGRVVVGFVIDVDGSITDVKIEESTSLPLNLSAYNTIANMPKWSPGKVDGKKVRVKYSIPLRYR